MSTTRGGGGARASTTITKTRNPTRTVSLTLTPNATSGDAVQRLEPVVWTYSRHRF